jgi:cation transport ATPase
VAFVAGAGRVLRNGGGGARRAQRRHGISIQRQRQPFYKCDQSCEAAAVLLVFILLGHWLETPPRAGASEPIRELPDLAPPMGSSLVDDSMLIGESMPQRRSLVTR